MSQPPLPPFVPGAVHVTPAEDDTEFENGPDADLAQQGDPNWNVPQREYTAADAAHESTEGRQFPTPQPNPLATAEEASRIAGAALHICDANHINLSGKLYLKLEAWTGIARIAGAIPGIETVKDNVLGGIAGITAKSTLKTNTGKLLSEAEGFVGNDEPFWVQKPVSDRVNMAQTRAVGRVCRLVYSFIVQIMNKEYGRSYEVTPAEEMLASQHAVQQSVSPQYQPPQPGVRHVMPTPQQPGTTGMAQPPYPHQWPQQPQYQPPQPQPNVVYPDSHAFQPTPNQAVPVAQGNEVWQGALGNIEIKQVQGKRGISQLFIISLTDGRNASTFDKTIAGNAGQMIGRNVEMLVIPRGQGRYNVGQLRPL